MIECPVCKTDKFVSYDYGTHAGDFDGSYHTYETYICSKCNGIFSIHKVGKKDAQTDDIETMKIEWKKYVKPEGFCSIA